MMMRPRFGYTGTNHRVIHVIKDVPDTMLGRFKASCGQEVFAYAVGVPESVIQGTRCRRCFP